MTAFQKDPSAVLDYEFDWTGYLQAGETITAHAVTGSDGITVDSYSIEAGVVTAWISGGTAGRVYTVTCQITTDLGTSPITSRTDERSMEIIVVDQ